MNDELEGWVHAGQLLAPSLNWQVKIISTVTKLFYKLKKGSNVYSDKIIRPGGGEPTLS